MSTLRYTGVVFEMAVLYLVATPIGNMGDLSPRAKETLKNVDFIAAEDTRVAKKLLSAASLPSKPMLSYFEHNRREKGELILSRILNGENCALITDAGTPAVSDPGEDLVALCAENGVEVVPVPGCCAAVCGLAASGLPSGRWCFEGFLSVNRKSRKEHLDSLKDEKRTMIFYEAPHKLLKTLKDMSEAFGGNRRIAISRELTKLHEETLRMTLDEAVTRFDMIAPRGEFVLVVEGAQEAAEEDGRLKMQKAAVFAEELVKEGETTKDAVKKAAEAYKLKKNALYRLVLEKTADTKN